MVGDDLITTNQIVYTNTNTEVPNPSLKNNTTVHNFFISSNNRDVNLYPKAAAFTTHLVDPLTNIISIKLCNISVNRKSDVISKRHILEWKYLNTATRDIPIELIHTIEKIDAYFKLIRVLYGYTRVPVPVEKGILFSFKPNYITIQLLGSGDQGYYDLFKLIDRDTFPLRVRFVSVDKEIEFSCMVDNIEEFDNSTGGLLKKMYKLTLQGDTACGRPFQQCVENQGHILMYIYNPITEAIAQYIPSYYSRDNYLIDYDTLLRNPNIHNSVIFGEKIQINLETFLSPHYLNIPLIDVVELPLIDLPRPGKQSLFINVDTLLSCKKCIEDFICYYENREFVWKCDFKNYLVLSHYQVLGVVPETIGNRSFINHPDVTDFNVIRVQNSYYSIRRDLVSGRYYFYNYSNIPMVKPILLLSPCTVTPATETFFTTLGIDTGSPGTETSVWNNFKYSPEIAVEKTFIYGLSNNLIIQTNSFGDLRLGDRVSLSNLGVKNHGVLCENIPKFITNIKVIDDLTVFMTINLGSFYMGSSVGGDLLQIGEGGYLRKIIPFRKPQISNLYITMPDCNYIETLNNRTLHKVFAILNSKNDLVGGIFKTPTPLKNLHDLKITVLQKDGSVASDVTEANFVFEITQSHTR